MLKRRASLLAGQALVFAAFFGLWELAVRLLHTRPVILPAPSVIFAKIWEQRELLLVNTWPQLIIDLAVRSSNSSEEGVQGGRD